MLTGFAGATQSFQVQIGGNTSAVLGAGGLAINNGNVAAAVNAIPGFAGTVAAAGAGNGGFTLMFAGASANTDVPAISIVNCTGTCVATVRETAKGGSPLPSWPAGGTVGVSTPTAAGYTLTFSGAYQGTDVDALTIGTETGLTGAVAETTKGTTGILPPGATGIVNAWGGGNTLDDTGFQVTYGAGLGGADQPSLSLDVTGASVLRRRDRTGRPGREQGLHRHRHGQPRPGRGRRRPRSRSRCARRSRSPAAAPTPTATR